MKIAMKCSACMRGDGLSEFEPRPVWELTFLLQSEGRYEWECPKGHKQSIALAHAHYEILAEVALQALIDGYPREAVLSFTGAAERLMEAYVKGVWRSSDAIDKAAEKLIWDKLKKSSERQIGLFVGTYVVTEGVAIQPLDTNLANFRNDVVHNGVIPTYDQAASYGQSVLDWMLPVQEAARCHKGWWKQFENLGPESLRTKFAMDFASEGVPVLDQIEARKVAKAKQRPRPPHQADRQP